MKPISPELSRRRFLKSSAAATLLAGLPKGWVGAA
ncbi:MAG: twin-arginine translocation signal domain-containing protein [Limisphaerales bacterium]